LNSNIDFRAFGVSILIDLGGIVEGFWMVLGGFGEEIWQGFGDVLGGLSTAHRLQFWDLL
jgi:hypothetical protein